MTERETRGAPRKKMKRTLPGATALVGDLVPYIIFLFAQHHILVCSSQKPGHYWPPAEAASTAHESFPPAQTSGCFSCPARTRTVGLRDATTPSLHRAIFGPSFIQAKETTSYGQRAGRILRPASKAGTKKNGAPLPSDAKSAGASEAAASKRLKVQKNFEELQQLLEDKELQDAAINLLRDLVPPPSGPQQAGFPRTIAEWLEFEIFPAANSGSAPSGNKEEALLDEAMLTREYLLYRHRLQNLAFLAFSFEPTAAQDGVAEAPQAPDEAFRHRLERKLVHAAGKALGFSELERPDAKESGAGSTAAASTSSERSPQNPEPQTSPQDTKRGGGYRTIDIRGLSGTMNPFLLMRFLLLGIALTGYQRYFDENFSGETLSFFGSTTLLSSLSPLRTPELFDEMTRTPETPRKKQSMISRLVRRSASANTGIPSWNSVNVAALPEGNHKFLLSTLQRLLEVILIYVKQQVEVLKEAKVPVEPSMSPADNMRRLHAFACRPDASSQTYFPCSFEDTLLHGGQHQQAEELVAPDEDVAESNTLRQDLEVAFMAITALGSSLWIARLLSDPRLGVAANAWYAYDTDKFATLLASFKANAKKALLPYGLQNLLTPPRKRQKEVIPDVQAVERAISSKYDSRTALRACLYAFLLVPRVGTNKEGRKTPLHFVEQVFANETAPAFALRRASPVSIDNLVEKAEPLGLTYLWLFEFLAHGGSAASLAKSRSKAVKTAAWAKFVHSHGGRFIRRIFKKWKVGLTARQRQKRLRSARELLLRLLPRDWETTVTSVFRFTAHSAALQQATEFHSLFRDKTTMQLRQKSYVITAPTNSLEEESAVKRCESQIHKWSKYGMDPAVLEADEQNRSFKGNWESLKLENMPTPDVSEWWRRVHRLVLDYLGRYLEHEKYLEGLGDNIYTLVRDSTARMEEANSADDTFFLARIDQGTRQTKLQRATRQIKKGFKKVYRAAPAPEHVVWVGVGFDILQITKLLTRLRDIARGISDTGTAILVDEAFLGLVAEAVELKTGAALRYPPQALRNISVLSIRPDYAVLNSLQRKAEFDHSLCADHCVSLWQVILAFVYPALLNPSMLVKYEEEFSASGAEKMTSSPDYVNSFRYVFKSDAALDFWEYSTPRHIRDSLRGMEEGQSFMFANLMRLAGHFYQTSLGLHSLGHSLQAQAPFMGEFVKDWIRKRRAARKRAIFAALTLGFMFVYTALSALDIVKVLKDVGMAPIQECSWNSIMQELACVVVAGSQSVTAPVFAAMSDVFLVGLYSGIGSVAMGALAVASVYSIVRSESRTVMRFEMILGQLFVKLWRRMKKFGSKVLAFVHERKAVMTTMMSRAAAATKGKAEESLAPDVNETGVQILDTVLKAQPKIGSPE